MDNQNSFRPAEAEELALFSIPFLRGYLPLDHDIVAAECRHLVGLCAERHPFDDQKNYTTYFEEDIRIQMHSHKWFKDFSDIIKDTYIKFIFGSFGKKVEHLKRSDIHLFAWISVYNKPHQHEAHNHVNSLISGTYYVKRPDDGQPIKFQNPNLLANYGHQTDDKPQESEDSSMLPMGAPSSHGEVMFYPKKGEFLLWPSYIMHSVPNWSDKANDNYERIAISFNLKHREEIDNTDTGTELSYDFMR
jgi:uncharacterized protein (TIGR02466 family)